MHKILYLIEQPLDERNYDRFGIQKWTSRGWDVEVWDLTALAFPVVWADFIASGGIVRDFAGYFLATSKRQLEKRCCRLGKLAYFIDFTGDGRHSVGVKRLLKRRGAKRVVYTGLIPLPLDGGNSGVISRLSRELAKGPMVTAKWLLDAVVRKSAAASVKPDIFVACGEKSIPKPQVDQEIVYAHSLDYDIYLEHRGTASSSSEKYAVFLDQNICFAPDYIHENVAPYATPGRYFPTICRGLRLISTILGVRIAIAAHPRLPRQREFTNFFEGLTLEYDKTAELIANSEFVVCHYTTAIQFAVLFRKAVIFITTDELQSSSAAKYIHCYAEVLGKSPINVDADVDGVDWACELSIDTQKYDEYRIQYIKTVASPETPFWDIIINHVSESKMSSSHVAGEKRFLRIE